MIAPRAVISTLCLALMIPVFGAASDNAPKSKPGPLTGTWECMSHGGSEGDMAFTLYLDQAKEVVTGSVSSPMGGADITTGSFKEKLLELQIDSDRGRYVVMGKLQKGQLSGTWSRDNTEKGTWEGKRVSLSR